MEINIDELYDPEDFRQVPTELYDVPISELGITGRRSPAAKTQAKTDARKMLAK